MFAMTGIHESSVTQRIIAESKALRAALANMDNARDLVRGTFEAPRSGPEGEVIATAMLHILGTATAPLTLSAKNPDMAFFCYTANAWSNWVLNDPAMAKKWLRQAGTITEAPGGALHLMALRPWKAAIEALLARNTEEAKKLFRRSLEVSGQMGTSTNVALQWSYAASFFRH